MQLLQDILPVTKILVYINHHGRSYWYSLTHWSCSSHRFFNISLSILFGTTCHAAKSGQAGELQEVERLRMRKNAACKKTVKRGGGNWSLPRSLEDLGTHISQGPWHTYLARCRFTQSNKGLNSFKATRWIKTSTGQHAIICQCSRKLITAHFAESNRQS